MFTQNKVSHSSALILTGIGLCLAAPLAVANTPSSADLVAACDAVAAHPDDPDSIGPPHVKAEIDLPKAIDACHKASEAEPDNMRIRYQYARMLFYSGERNNSIREMKTAADNGYRQAQFVYGVFVNYQREGAPADLCITEKYWKKSAAQGRQAAIVNYVKERIKGRFAGCDDMASKEEMSNWLKEAESESGSYYETLFIKDLSERLAVKNSDITPTSSQDNEPKW
ncbi:hypothetical protein AB1K62_08080 [Parasphingorhabdus sp. JC815]|uniref:hypothetical protein n=1 Tax=Parasphingorhabdus sp. JC815 TaxID=3232140 RepID=UPI003458ED66